MVFQDNDNMDTSFNAGKKLTPGPYRATKMWNEIVRQFRENMSCKKHRRHLRTYNDCFSASESIDRLHGLLKKNPNIGKDVTRQQTIKLLRKFLRNHVIEDVQGRWGSENFEDDGKLFRFPPGVSIDQALRYPLGNLDVNTEKSGKKSSGKKHKRKSHKGTNKEKENLISDGKKDETETITAPTSATSTTTDHLKRALPPVPTIPKCRVVSPAITELSIRETWKTVLFSKLQTVLQLDTLHDVVAENECFGECIRHNATRIGRSGVVQVNKEEDLPYWALSAMTCLANWPNGKNTGLPCYPGFERDVFKAVCEYFCENPAANNNTKKEIPEVQPEPLLTYELYELFTNILCLIEPENEHRAIEALQLALLLLPPANRRKLHLLLRLLSKMCNNRDLEELGGHLSTRMMLLQRFSKHILSCNEEVYLDELIATRLVTFLIDNHAAIMKVPEDLESRVEEKTATLRRPSIRYEESNEDIPIQYSFVPSGGVRSRIKQKNHDRNKRKSTDIMKSWDKLVTSIRSKQTYTSSSGTDTSDSESYVQPFLQNDTTTVPLQQQLLRHRHCQMRPRTRTVGSGSFNPRRVIPSEESKKTYIENLNALDLDESRMKPAKSCSDIFEMKISPTSSKVTSKSSELASSSWNLRLRPMFGRPFSKLRKSKA